MTTEQLSQLELQTERVREEIIDAKVFYSYEELDTMSQSDRMKAVMQMKQDETMKWQRMAAKLHYYIMVGSLILGFIAAFALLIIKG